MDEIKNINFDTFYKLPRTRNFSEIRFNNTLLDIKEIQKYSASQDELYDNIEKYFDYICDLETHDFERSTKTKISCYSGCKNCCSYLVTAYPIEVGRYVKMILSGELKINEENLIQQNKIDYDEKVSSNVYEVDRKWKNVSKNHRECIFLENNTGRCKIYKERPLKCRQEFSIDDPQKCSSDHLKHKLIPSMVATYSIDSHASNIFGTVYMSKAIFNGLKKNNYNFSDEK